MSNPSEKSPSSTIINGEIVNKSHSTSNTNTSLPFGSTVANIMAEAVHAVSGGGVGGGGSGGGGGGTSSTNKPGVTGIGGSHTANVCESCHKTKFADNSGNSCVYCKRRTCTRCGNHSEIKPNVIQWVCKQCIQKLGTTEGQKMSPNSTLPQHTETSASSITGRLGESIKSFISKPKTPDIKRQLPQVNIRNQNLPYSPDASSGNRLQNAGSGRLLPKPYSTMRSNSLDADKTAYIGPDQSGYYGDQKRPYTDRYPRHDHTPGEYGHVRPRRTSGDYYASDEFHPYREVSRQYPYDSRMPNNVYLDTLYTGDSFTSDPSDSPCQSGGSIKHSVSYGRTSAHDYPRYQEMGYRSDQHFDSQSPYLKPNYSSSSFSSQKRNIPNWENYRYGAIPPRYRDQLRHHQLHHLSFSSSDGEDFSVVDDGSVQYQEPRRRLLPSNFERKPSPYSQGTVTDDDDPASQFYISKRSTTPYYGGQLKPHVWDQDRALSLCDEPPRYPYDYETQSEHHRRLPENRNSAYQGDVRYNHEDGTIITTRRPAKGSSSHPVTWNVSEDGRRLIGHMILRKKSDPQFGEPGSVLGLKLAGGRLDRSRRLCAFVTQIKPGSPADVVGHLRPGDEILEWNGQSLRGLSADEVSQIIYQSKDEIQVELVAQREINNNK
ncbi:unnamed protein product [Trichobilharzia szidati]|nr:unnamed protein product [Trichobilharzia szidati]